MMTMERDHNEREIQDLLEQAGPREEVPADDLRAIREASRREWRQRFGEAAKPPTPFPVAPSREEPLSRSKGEGVHRHRRSWLALAASLLLATVAGTWWWWSGEDAIVAMVERVRGAANQSGETLAPGEEIPIGTLIATEAGSAVALRFAGGSLRLDGASRLRLESATVATLEAGAVYFDSGAAAESDRDGSQPGLEIRTALGSFRDIGTQFEVRLLAGASAGTSSGTSAGTSSGTSSGSRVGVPGALGVRLRVREGKVLAAFEGWGESGEAVGGTPAGSTTLSTTAGAGESLTLRPDGSTERGTVALHGDSWEWVWRAAPAFDGTAGATLRAYLAWLERETNWRVEFQANPSILDERVYGSEGESLEATLGAVMASLELRSALTAEGVLQITDMRALQGSEEAAETEETEGR